jgi:hypothetical protein
MNNTVPQMVSNYDLLVNPVHVVDLAVALPALIIIAYQLIKKNEWGYILTPVMLVFMILLALALAGMTIMLKIKNISEDLSVSVIFLFLAMFSAFFLVLLLRKLHHPNRI